MPGMEYSIPHHCMLLMLLAMHWVAQEMLRAHELMLPLPEQKQLTASCMLYVIYHVASAATRTL